MIKRLIWDSNAPAPFESAWSLFIKIMALNYLSPCLLHGIISVDGDVYHHGLDFRRSHWVDFRKLELMLGVSENRLRGCFLDQLFPTEYSTGVATQGIKICMECLAKGYHSVFFELPFIDRCPWHDRALEPPCQNCYATVSYLGLRKPRLGCKQIQEGRAIVDVGSGCGHIKFNSDSIHKLNQLFVSDEKEVVKHCMQLFRWAENALSRPEFTEKLLSPVSYAQPVLLSKSLSAAEQIAGSCPWKSGIDRTSVGWVQWQQPVFAHSQIWPVNECSGQYFQCYRAIRRHLFRRHVRPHRNCLVKMLKLSDEEFQELDSDRVCPVILAYFAWRAFIEMSVDIPNLLGKKVAPIGIAGTHLNFPGYINTLRGACNLLVVRFYNLWEKIEKEAGARGFSISIIRGPVQEDTLLIDSRVEEIYWDNCQSRKWTVLIPKPGYLEAKGLSRCSGRRKKYSVTHSFVNNTVLYRYAIDGEENGFSSVIFQAKRTHLGNIQRKMKHINV